jgi:hypothetical protein
MNNVLEGLKQEAAPLIPTSTPQFYRNYMAEIAFAREYFFDHPLVLRCREDVLPFLNDKFGHGIEHAKKVAIEAHALILIETREWGREETRYLGLLAQLAGLLHDVCRLEGDHAVKGAELSGMILRDYPLSEYDLELIAHAIRNHEAFKETDPPRDENFRILGDVLYDADKFRWGPDNFVTTLWEICNYQEWSLQEIADRFPRGLEKIAMIQSTFRTRSGQIYGPEFIDTGLEIGRVLYQKINNRCRRQDCTGIEI